MKKLTVAAAFFAVSSVLANAATVLTVDTATLKAGGGTYTVSGQTIGSGYGDFSVSVVFDADQLNTLMTTQFTGTNKNLINVQNSSSTLIGVKYDGSSSVWSSGFYGAWSSSYTTYAFTDDTSTSSTAKFSTLNTYFAANTVTAAALTFTVSSEGTKAYLTLKTSDSTVTLIGTNSDLKSNSFGSISTLCYDAGLVTYLTVDNTVLSADDAAKQNEANIIAVPEPSAFGLLAGVGALALAVSRRRRGR